MSNTIPKPFLILIHVVAWLILIHLIWDLEGLVESFRDFLEVRDLRYFDIVFLYLPLYIVFFYFNAYILVPKWFNKKTWGYYLLALLGCFLSNLAIVFVLFYWAESVGYDPPTTYQDLYDEATALIILFWGASSSYALYNRAVKEGELKLRAKEHQLNAELQFLKAQVQPHFLFNTLNTIYSLATDEDADQTSNAVLKLSQMMRYMTREAASEKVNLGLEIEFLENYIALQQLRIGSSIPIDFTIKVAAHPYQIAPLLFIPFVENAFKYGVSYQQESFIQIYLAVDEKGLTFSTKNRVHAHQQSIVSSGIGLSNVRKRLEYLYPQRHRLVIEEKEGLYIVDCQIQF